MSFDCLIIDHNNNQNNLKYLKKTFPNARVLPFVSSYFDMIRSFSNDFSTQFFWVLSTLIDYKGFDFDFIPEQFQDKQIHTWALENQTEGDTFLIPRREFISQVANLKFLRDYKDINYKKYRQGYHAWPKVSTNFDNLIEGIKKQTSFYCHYYLGEYEEIIPSLWDKVKIYSKGKYKNNCLVPNFKIKNEVYEYPYILNLDGKFTTMNFDIVFVSNNEMLAEQNYKRLEQHIEKNNLKNSLKSVSNINGRSQALKKAAEISDSEYFYCVPAKIEVDDLFHFNFVPDIFKSPRHYIFKCFNSAINFAYGHQSIVLMSKKLALETESGHIDFTLASNHESVDILAGKTNYNLDPVVAFRTSFREVVKLRYFLKEKPTVENRFLLDKWKSINEVQNKHIIQKAVDEAMSFDLTDYLETYNWKFVDDIYNRVTS